MRKNYTTMVNNALVFRAEKDAPLTIEEFFEQLGVHITVNHSGKMSGMGSISTACVCNKHCLERRGIEGSICQGCFAYRTFDMRNESFEMCFTRNYEILTSVEIPVELMPVLNYSIFRIESFGDIENEIQAKNYWNLIKANPYTQFGWWTKNYGIVEKIFDKYGKPENVSLVVSSVMINEEFDIQKFAYADKIFTVFKRDYIDKNDVEINCGSKQCVTCQICYRNNDVVYIREKKK